MTQDKIIKQYLPAFYQIDTKYLNDENCYEQLKEVMPEEFKVLKKLIIELINTEL